MHPRLLEGHRNGEPGSLGSLGISHRFLHDEARANKPLVGSSTPPLVRCLDWPLGISIKSDFKKKENANVSLRDRPGPRVMDRFSPDLKKLGTQLGI